MNPVNVFEQAGPIILGQPHGGTFVPADIWMSLNERGQKRVDTDWRIGDLYADLLPSATVVSANFHRYVIDANRSASNESLYPGQNTTGLCPLTDFAGLPIYQPGKEPNAEQIKQRISDWHQPYHQAIEDQIARVKQLHGIAICLTVIPSVVPCLICSRVICPLSISAPIMAPHVHQPSSRPCVV